MANPVCEVLLSEMPLVVPTGPHPRETGGVVDFWGVVRQTEEGAEITGIAYEAHRAMAEHQLRAVAAEGVAAFDIKQVTIRHRLGFVPAGEASLFVRVGGRHRAEAFRAASWIVDELKKRATIWKQPRAVSSAGLPREIHPAGASTSPL